MSELCAFQFTFLVFLRKIDIILKNNNINIIVVRISGSKLNMILLSAAKTYLSIEMKSK